MEGARVRLDVAAAVLLWVLMMWVLMMWCFVRGGVGDLSVWHIWGLALSAAAAAATVAAYVSCATTKVMRKIERQRTDRMLS